jgi:hypothetical protein
MLMRYYSHQRRSRGMDKANMDAALNLAKMTEAVEGLAIALEVMGQQNAWLTAEIERLQTWIWLIAEKTWEAPIKWEDKVYAIKDILTDGAQALKGR